MNNSGRFFYYFMSILLVIGNFMFCAQNGEHYRKRTREDSVPYEPKGFSASRSVSPVQREGTALPSSVASTLVVQLSESSQSGSTSGVTSSVSTQESYGSLESLSATVSVGSTRRENSPEAVLPEVVLVERFMSREEMLDDYKRYNE